VRSRILEDTITNRYLTLITNKSKIVDIKLINENHGQQFISTDLVIKILDEMEERMNRVRFQISDGCYNSAEDLLEDIISDI
jgi:hypothetical protein